jgi:hypothetical protein
MKIADQSCSISKDGEVEYVSLCLFAHKFDDLPICQRIGDIIRIHRASVGFYSNRKQLTANIFFNSSWALFSGQSHLEASKQEVKDEAEESKVTVSSKSVQEFYPNYFYGKQFNFDHSETKLIKALRKWTAASFEKKQMLSTAFITRLENVPKVGAQTMS